MVDLVQVHAMIEEATQAVPGSVTGEAPLEALPGWDSMGIVVFLEVVVQQTGAELAVYDLRACETTTDIHELIQRTLAP